MNEFPSISPFKLLQPYEKHDVRIYFGRENETRRLAEALMRSKFIMLYGASGTGKTSLIQCGLQGMFSPRDWLPVFVRRGKNFVESIRGEILAQYERRFRQRFPDREPDLPADLSLREAVKALFNITYVPVYLILDQFEEIFTLGDEQEQEAFFAAFRNLQLFEEDLFCKLLIVVREEYIAHFYRYEKDLPYLFEYRFRVEQMRSEQLLRVVEGTLNHPYENYPPLQLEAGVGAQILRNLTNKRGETDLIDLQVYLDRLYREDLERKPPGRDHLLFDADLVGNHQLENVLSDFLDQQVALVGQKLEPAPDWDVKVEEGIFQILFKLVSGQGTKQNASFAEIREELNLGKLEIGDRELEKCLDLLAAPDVRLLNRFVFPGTSEERFEIWHDRLAAQVFKKFSASEIQQREARTTLRNKKKRYEEEGGKGREYLSTGEIDLVSASLNLDRLEPSERAFLKNSKNYRVRQWYLRRLVVILIIGLGVAALLFGFNSWQKARLSALVAQSRLIATEDPTGGRQLLQKAVQIAPDDPAVMEAQYRIYSDNEFYEQSFEHPLPVRGVALAPTFQSTIYSWTDEAIYQWNRDGSLLDTIAIPERSVVELSPDGRWLIVGAWTGELTRLNAANLEQEQQVTLSEIDKIAFLAFDPDRRRLFVANPDRVVALPILDFSQAPVSWNVEKKLSGLAFDTINNALLQGHARGSIGVMPTDSNWVDIWNRHSDQVLSFTVSPGGDTIVSAGRDGLLNFWNREGRLLLTLKGHDRRINAVTYAPDGRRLFSAGTDYRIKSWSPQGDLIATYKGHSSFVTDLAVSADGRYFVSAGEDRMVRLWKVESKVEQHFGPHENGVSGVAITPDGTTVMTASDAGRDVFGETINDQDFNFQDYLASMYKPPPQSAFLWEARTGERLREMTGHKGGINEVAMNKDGAFFATASDDATAIIWNQSGESMATLTGGHRDKVLAVTFSPGGQHLATAGTDSLAILWSKEGKPLQRLNHPDVVKSVSFSSDGRIWATGCADGAVRWYDLEGRELRSLRQADSRSVECVSFSPDGRYLLVGELNNIWRLYDRQGVQVFRGTISSENKTGGAAIRSLAFSVDGSSFCLGAEGGLVEVFRIIEGQPFHMRSFVHYPPRAVLSVRFAPDGQHILTGTNDGWARLWTLEP